MNKYIVKSILVAGIATSIVSCTKDEIKSTGYSVPSTYSFSNASYTGQTSRLNMLGELSSEMKKANSGEAIDADKLKKMYANDGYTWTSSPFTAEQPTKQLKSKTFPDFQDDMENWMDSLANIAGGTVGEDGKAGLVTSNDGNKKYVFTANGFEPVQLIEKGIMAGCFYFQGTSVYLSESKLFTAENDKNDEGKNYTKMQHYWDESFGYTALPQDISATNVASHKADGNLRFYSKYIVKAHDAGLKTITDIMEKGYLKGRAAIDNKDYPSRNEAIKEVRKNWEMILVASGLHYLNGALKDLSDDALRNHQLSEAYAFIHGLKFNEGKMITQAQIDEVLASLGNNFYKITPAQINEAKTKLASIYGVNASDF